jgi:hypothetical protein
MKRRDFLKVGVATTVAVPLLAERATKPLISGYCEALPDEDWDWSVEFTTVTAQITQDTYDAFFKDTPQDCLHKDFLGYLLRGTTLPPCEVGEMRTFDTGYEILTVTFSNVKFTSNTRALPDNFFAGYEDARFSMFSPDSKSGMYLSFSKMIYSA